MKLFELRNVLLVCFLFVLSQFYFALESLAVADRLRFIGLARSVLRPSYYCDDCSIDFRKVDGVWRYVDFAMGQFIN